MNIQARILARKMVLTYLYEKYSAHEIARDQHILKEINNIDIAKSSLEQKDTYTEKELSAALEKSFLASDYDDDMTYLVKNCFAELAERGIDTVYINTMAPAFEKYADVIGPLVNKHTSTFTYEDMDIIDRVIFLLGYAEFHLMKTPKEVILNETVELAKKYGDEGSPKLINGILHKVLSADAD